MRRCVWWHRGALRWAHFNIRDLGVIAQQYWARYRAFDLFAEWRCADPAELATLFGDGCCGCCRLTFDARCEPGGVISSSVTPGSSC